MCEMAEMKIEDIINTELEQFMVPIKKAFQEIRDRLDIEETKLLDLYSGLRKSIYQQTSKKESKIEELNNTKIGIETEMSNPELKVLKSELIKNIDKEIQFISSDEEEDIPFDEKEMLKIVTENIQSFQTNLRISQNEMNRIMSDKLLSDKHNSLSKQSEKLIPNFVKSMNRAKYKNMPREEALKLYSKAFVHGKSICQKGNKSGELNGPLGITIDRKERVFIADCYNHRVQVFTLEGLFLSEFGKNELSKPYSIGLHENSVFVSDYGRNAVFKYEIPNYHLVAQTEKDQLNNPNGFAVSRSSDMYVADSKNNRIAVFGAKLNFVKEIGKGKLHKPCDAKIRFHHIYAVDNGKPYHVHVFSKTGECLQSFISLEGETFWNFICFDRFNNILISDNAGRAVYVFTSEGVFVNRSVLCYGPTGIAVTHDNCVVWANVNDSVVYSLRTL